MMRWALQFRRYALAAVALICALPGLCVAQDFNGVSSNKPAALANVGIDEKLGQSVPGNLTFKDESGQDVQLSDIFAKGKPVILTLVYFRCPQLCTLVLNDLTTAMNVIPLTAGKDFEVVTISFDPKEGPALASAKKQQYLRAYQRTGASSGWHFLTGSQENIAKVADAVGFRYIWDDVHKQFVHASAIMVLSPTGVVSHYIYGTQYMPNDVRLSIDSAANGQTLGTTERVYQFCFQFDPATGKWTWAILRMIQVGGGLTILIVGGLVGLLIMRERKRGAAMAVGVPAPH